jgi:hypothetical protein
VADYRTRIERAHRALLHQGEPILATVRAAAEGSPLGALSGLLGALGGLVVLFALAVDRRNDLRLRFILESSAEITFTTYRLDHPDEFVRVLNRAREEWKLVAPPVSSPTSIPVVPPGLPK